MCSYDRNIMDSRRALLCSAVSILVMYCALSWIGVRFDMSSSSYCADLVLAPRKISPCFRLIFSLAFFPISFALWGLFVYLSSYLSSGMGYNAFTIRLKS